MALIKKKGFLLVYNSRNFPNTTIEFSYTTHYAICRLREDLWGSFAKELHKFFESVTYLDIIVNLHSCIINKHYVLENVNNLSCKDWAIRLNSLNLNVEKTILYTGCYGIFNHINIKEFTEGSIIISLSTYNTLTWLSYNETEFFDNDLIKREKNLILFYFKKFNLPNLKQGTFFQPILSRNLNEKIEMTYLYEKDTMKGVYNDINVYYDLFNIFHKKEISKLSTNSYFIRENLPKLKRLFYFEEYFTAKEILIEIKMIINKTNTITKTMPIKRTISINYLRIFSDFQEDPETLLNLIDYSSPIDFSNSLLSDRLVVNKETHQYIEDLYKGNVTHSFFKKDTMCLISVIKITVKKLVIKITALRGP